MESLGFVVLRFENRFVFQELEDLKNTIREAINRRNELP
jgi:very-short-patch-repair endonuclease